MLVLLPIKSATAQEHNEFVTGDYVSDIRLMLTAPDNNRFDFWTVDEIIGACTWLYYNDPEDAYKHGQVVAGAVIQLGKTGDPRVIPVLIDAVDTHAPQALYALGGYPTDEVMEVLTANIRNEDVSARDNVAESLRRIVNPDEITDEWTDAVETALAEVESWLIEESDYDIAEYFLDAKINLETLLEDSLNSGVANN